MAAMLAACSSDNLPVQSAWQSVEGQGTAQGAVGFDAYLSRATSRNGAEGELTLNSTAAGKVSLEGKGFGVFAYYTDNADYDGQSIPNFMWNQQVAKTDGSWTYSPVKYWPNEFGSAEAEEADRVSFFAYAPYTPASAESGKTKAATGEAEGTGITAFSRNDASGDPLVKYVVNLDPKRAVDLCWGTVDSDRSWTKANKIPDPENPGSETSETQPFVKGMPWLNVERPSSVSSNDSKVKFQFEHALSQLNIQVKNDVDIASPETASPGAQDVASQTKVWIRSITLTGLSMSGALNLHNTVAGKARWLDYKDSRELLAGETCTVHDGREDSQEGTLASTDEKVTGINPALVQTDGYVVTGADIASAALTCATTTSTGVTSTFQNVFSGAASGDGAAAAGDPIYVIPTGEAVKVTIAYDVETYSPNLATYLSDGKTRGASISNVITKDITLASGADMTMENGKKYTVKLHLGLNSVKFEAAVSEWADGDEAEASLPANDPGGLSDLKTWVNDGNANDKTYLGYYVKADGSISKENSDAIGIVAYYGDAAVDESAPDSRILVLAMEDASSSAQWKTTGSDGESAYNDPDALNGIAFTNAYGNNAAYPAAQVALGYSADRPTGASIWFLPSKAQWDLMIAGGKTGIISSDYYWSSTEYKAKDIRAWVYRFNTPKWDSANKGDDIRRLRTAFAY